MKLPRRPRSAAAPALPVDRVVLLWLGTICLRVDELPPHTTAAAPPPPFFRTVWLGVTALLTDELAPLLVPDFPPGCTVWAPPELHDPLTRTALGGQPPPGCVLFEVANPLVPGPPGSTMTRWVPVGALAG